MDVSRSPAGVNEAERVIGSITAMFPMIVLNPRIGRHRPNLGEGGRSLPISNYLVYYRRDKRGVIRILHVRHAARDEKKIFGV